MSDKEVVLVIDFGGPTNQVLLRKIRDLGVYSELVPHTITASEVEAFNPKGIIISGGPYTLEDENKFRIDAAIFELGIPLLGLCYGMQLVADYAGMTVKHLEERSYQTENVTVKTNHPLFQESDSTFRAYASNGDVIEAVKGDWQVDVTNEVGDILAMSNAKKDLYGLRFFPESTETEGGTEILNHFLYDIAKADGTWSTEAFIEQELKSIRETVGDRNVLCALSGGVDSSVVAALIHKAIGKQLTCIFVDHGLLRKNEAKEVMASLAGELHMNIIQVDAKDRFLGKLKGETDPETKRKIIGNEFIEVFDAEAGKLENMHFLAQGTLYSDVVESGSALGKAVKSHHNVGGLPEELEFELLEPIRTLYKDEVRAVGSALGLPDRIVWRQPFPGPGLGVRVLGEVNEEKLDIVREADAILREEIANAGLDREIWQYFAVLPNLRSVGVRDSNRVYDHAIGLRAVHSVDGMTSDYARIDWDVLEKISARILAEVEHVNRVLYDITPKPPGTIEWE